MPWTATILVIDMLWDSTIIVLTHILEWIIFGQSLNELAVKKLAMLGCALLMLAHSVRDKISANSYAGGLPAIATRHIFKYSCRGFIFSYDSLLRSPCTVSLDVPFSRC